MADEFALFGIDANDGETTARESVAKVTEVEELMVAVGTVIQHLAVRECCPAGDRTEIVRSFAYRSF